MNSGNIRVKTFSTRNYVVSNNYDSYTYQRYGVDEIDDEVNEWLKENECEIVSIQFTETKNACSCFIVYKI